MKTISQLIVPLIMFLGISMPGISQNVGNWNFNGVLTGTGTASNSVSAVSLGSSIPTGAYNASTVYFGENGWPAGGLDNNAYLEFSLSPNSGKKLNLTFLAMEIRRSTTGTPAGSGPMSWSLRSNLDGFAADIASGTLTTNSTPATTVALPASFLNLTSTISFRLYGYNSVVTTGGLNRFVYDNISAVGTVILPILIDDFQAALTNDQNVQLSWTLNGNEPVASIEMERSASGTDFMTIRNITPTENSIDQEYLFLDESLSGDAAEAFYRLKITSKSGSVYYSGIRHIVLDTDQPFAIKSFSPCASCSLRISIRADKSDQCHFTLYSLQGRPVGNKTESVSSGNQQISLDHQPLTHGLYVLIAESAGKRISSKVWIN